MNLLTELLGVKKFKDMSRDEIADYAEKSGQWKKLGKGLFGHAMERNGIVYKFWMADTGYEEFVKFCKEQRSKYLPRYLSDVKTLPAKFFKVKSAPDEIKYVKMEKIGDATNTVVPLFKTDEGVTVKVKGRALMNNLRQHYYKLYDEKDVKNIILRSVVLDEENIDRDWTPEGAELVKIILGLVKLAKQHELKLDFHDGNYGGRGEQLVIYDPLAKERDIDNARMWRDFESTLLDRR